MDHEAASLQLSEWVARRLPREAAAEVAAHVEDCAECRALTETLVSVLGEVAEHGAALWSPHPVALDLARFVGGGVGLETDEFARIGAHVRACPACSTEARLAREAQAPSAWRSVGAWLPEIVDRRSLAGLAFAALAVVLAYPAYLGLVEYPRARGLAAHSGPQRDGVAGAPVPTLPTGSALNATVAGGPAAVLMLTGESRGATYGIPVARLRAGQAQLSLLIDAAPPRRDPVEIELRDRAGTLVWHARARAAELWDEQQRVTSLAIPVSALKGNEFVLSLGGEGRAPEVSRRFRVTAAAPVQPIVGSEPAAR